MPSVTRHDMARVIKNMALDMGISFTPETLTAITLFIWALNDELYGPLQSKSIAFIRTALLTFSEHGFNVTTVNILEKFLMAEIEAGQKIIIR